MTVGASSSVDPHRCRFRATTQEQARIEGEGLFAHAAGSFPGSVSPKGLSAAIPMVAARSGGRCCMGWTWSASAERCRSDLAFFLGQVDRRCGVGARWAGRWRGGPPELSARGFAPATVLKAYPAPRPHHDGGGAPPGTRTPNRCLKSAGQALVGPAAMDRHWLRPGCLLTAVVRG
jgi:hypothetical protein